MKYYSEITKTMFNTVEELQKAEAAVIKREKEKADAEKAKAAQRATRAKEVEKAFKDAEAARRKAAKLLQDFTKDYGYFHMSYSLDDTDEETEKIPDFFGELANFLKF